MYKKRDELSKIWNIMLHVDHIIPLNNDTVCGLHCFDNMQLLDIQSNSEKSNKYESDW